MHTYRISWVLPDSPQSMEHTVEGDELAHNIGSRENMRPGDLAEGTDGTDIIVERNGATAFSLHVPPEGAVWLEYVGGDESTEW